MPTDAATSRATSAFVSAVTAVDASYERAASEHQLGTDGGHLQSLLAGINARVADMIGTGGADVARIYGAGTTANLALATPHLPSPLPSKCHHSHRPSAVHQRWPCRHLHRHCQHGRELSMPRRVADVRCRSGYRHSACMLSRYCVFIACGRNTVSSPRIQYTCTCSILR